MPIKQALGRGLSALIPDISRSSSIPTVTQNTLEIQIDKIQPNPGQPRKEFGQEKLRELMDSIKDRGILQPILVRQIGDRYEIIAGERRYRAAKALGLNKIPALIKNAPAGESLQLALIENLQREDLNPIEEARAYQKLQEEFHLTQESIAKAVGKDRSSVANALRLLSLPEKILNKLLSNQLTAGHAKVLLGMTDKRKQEDLCERIIKEGLSVRQAEQLSKEGQEVKVFIAKRNVKQLSSDPHQQFLEDELQRVMGTRVRISSGVKGGRIQIEYYSNADLERIAHLLGIRQN